MLRRIIVLSAFAAGLSSFGAQAAVLPEGEDLRPAAHQAAEGIQLAQYGDVEIYYDEFGRRVVVDAYTGEVISVERPRRMERRLRRDAMRERRESCAATTRSVIISTIPRTWNACAGEKLREGGVIIAPPIDDYEDYSSRELPDGLERIS